MPAPSNGPVPVLAASGGHAVDLGVMDAGATWPEDLLRGLVVEHIGGMLADHHDALRELLRALEQRQAEALERLFENHSRSPLPASPRRDVADKAMPAQTNSACTSRRRWSRGGGPGQTSVLSPRGPLITGAAGALSKDSDRESHHSMFSETATRPSAPAKVQPRDSLEVQISRIEHKFNQDFMHRGSLFAPASESSSNRRTVVMRDTGVLIRSDPLRGCKAQRALRRFVATSLFDSWCGFVIILHIALIGAEAEISTLQREPHRLVAMMQLSTVCWFVLEIMLRAAASGPREFCLGDDWRWNAFDIALVLMAVFDWYLERVTSTGGNYSSIVRVVRILRMLRIVRSLRIIRFLRYVREFRKMLFAIHGSMQTLLMSLSLLIFTIYAFACCFTAGVSEHFWTTGEEDAELRQLYGSLMRTVYSLYLSVSAGRSWGEVATPLMAVGPLLAALFFLFITLTLFGILNVVTSVFVESAMRTAQHYRELLVQDKLREHENIVGHMREVFLQIDDDHSGRISMAEMEEFLADADLRLYMESLDISTGDTRALFRLLDSDGSGHIDIDEFCAGCMRMKGSAKSFDVHCVLFELERVARNWGEFMMFCEGKLNTMETILRHMVAQTDPAFTTEAAPEHPASVFDPARMRLGSYRKSLFRAHLDGSCHGSFAEPVLQSPRQASKPRP